MISGKKYRDNRVLEYNKFAGFVLQRFNEKIKSELANKKL